MKKMLLFTAVCLLAIGNAHAILIVDGVGSGSNYATIEDAATAFIASPSEDTIEIQTDGPIDGLDLRSLTIPRPLTVRAGAGFTPVIETAMFMIPTNESSTTVTLEGLNVNLPTADIPNGIPLFVGCNIVANNCTFQNAAVNPWAPAVACGYPSPATDSQLYLTSCTLQAHLALMVGRSVRDYYIKDSTLIGTSDIPGFASGIAHFLNYPPNLGFIPYQDSGYNPTPDVRTLRIENSLVQSTGKLFQWPPDNPWGDASRYLPETHSVGPFTAINTAFVSLGGTGNYNNIGHPSLPDTNEPRVTFKHCTFRKDYQYGAFYAQAGTTVTVENTLFDDPFVAGYTVGYADGQSTVTGTNNAYNIPAARATSTGSVPFETGGVYYRRDTADATDYITDLTGHIIDVSGETLVQARAAGLTPPVIVDIDLESRPQPIGALASDIGADEFAETTAHISDWQLF